MIFNKGQTSVFFSHTVLLHKKDFNYKRVLKSSYSNQEEKDSFLGIFIEFLGEKRLQKLKKLYAKLVLSIYNEYVGVVMTIYNDRIYGGYEIMSYLKNERIRS